MNDLHKSVDRSLSVDDKAFCDKDVSETEIKCNKSLGEDGIVNEFYQTFWYLIKKSWLIHVSFNRVSIILHWLHHNTKLCYLCI